MNDNNKKRISDAIDEIRYKVFLYSTHSVESKTRVPANALIWLAMSNNLLEFNLRILRDTLEKNNLEVDSSIARIDLIVPTDQDYLNAANDVLKYIDQMAEPWNLTH